MSEPVLSSGTRSGETVATRARALRYAAAAHWFGTVIIVVTPANWGRFARIIRAEALSLCERGFILIARLAGASPLRVAVRHLLPNVRNTFVVLLTLDIGLVIFMEAALSFVGLGVQPPDPSWGGMIAYGRNYLADSTV